MEVGMARDQWGEYLRAKEPGVREKAYAWKTAIDVANDVFAENAWYFRNALVRANYTNVPKGIEDTTEYLELFFRNLLLGESNVLQSRYLIVGGWKVPGTPTSNAATPHK